MPIFSLLRDTGEIYLIYLNTMLFNVLSDGVNNKVGNIFSNYNFFIHGENYWRRT